MNKDKEQQTIGEQRSGADQESQAGRDPNHIQFVIPSHPPQVSSPGLRKRTSILVGIAFVLLGLLMMFIAGESAADHVPAQSGSLVGNTDSLFVTRSGDFH